MNQELWEAIVAKLQELRELTIEQYEQQCGLDPVHDRARIDELYRGRRYLAPDYLATVVSEFVYGIRLKAVFPTVPRRTILAAIGASAYGPEGYEPPADVFHALDRIAAWDVGGAQRGFERLLAYGATLPEGPKDWQHRWDTAFESLLYVVEVAYEGRERAGAARRARGDVAENLEWVARRVLKQTDAQVKDTLNTELLGYCAIIRGYLVFGCSCNTRWKEMRLESQAKAQEHCSGHGLAAWDRRQSLNDFVWQAGIKRNLPDINDFRRGILAKLISEEHNLEVYPVLVCKRPECTGEIDIDGRCSNNDCRAIGAIGGKTEYRLASQGTRRGWFGRRCKGKHCGRVFPGRLPRCPVCGEQMSSKDTEIWIPTTAEPNDNISSTARPADEDLAEAESRDKLREHLASVRDKFTTLDGKEIDRLLGLNDPRGDQLRIMARHLTEEGRSVEHAADEAGIPIKKVQMACRRLRSLVHILRLEYFGDAEPDTEEDGP